MSSKCRKIGHDFHIIADDSTKILEQCSECGFKKRHYRGAVAQKHSKETQEYLSDHRRDIIQPGQVGWEIAWSAQHKAEQERQARDKQLERELDKEEAERAAYDPLNRKIIC